MVAEEMAWLAARHPGRVGLGVGSGAMALDFTAMGVELDQSVPLFEPEPPFHRGDAAGPRSARRIDRLWTDFLKSAMDQGSVPKQDPTLLTHAVVGFLWSVWAWYRPIGRYRLKDLQQFYTEAMLRMVGVDSPH
jgi:hypothetical protein